MIEVQRMDGIEEIPFRLLRVFRKPGCSTARLNRGFEQVVSRRLLCSQRLKSSFAHGYEYEVGTYLTNPLTIYQTLQT
jgi:hypothetical protein